MTKDKIRKQRPQARKRKGKSPPNLNKNVQYGFEYGDFKSGSKRATLVNYLRDNPKKKGKVGEYNTKHKITPSTPKEQNADKKAIVYAETNGAIDIPPTEPTDGQVYTVKKDKGFDVYTIGKTVRKKRVSDEGMNFINNATNKEDAVKYAETLIQRRINEQTARRNFVKILNDLTYSGLSPEILEYVKNMSMNEINNFMEENSEIVSMLYDWYLLTTKTVIGATEPEKYSKMTDDIMQYFFEKMQGKASQQMHIDSLTWLKNNATNTRQKNYVEMKRSK